MANVERTPLLAGRAGDSDRATGSERSRRGYLPPAPAPGGSDSPGSHLTDSPSLTRAFYAAQAKKRRRRFRIIPGAVGGRKEEGDKKKTLFLPMLRGGSATRPSLPPPPLQPIQSINPASPPPLPPPPPPPPPLSSVSSNLAKSFCLLSLYFALGLVVFTFFVTEFKGVKTNSFVDAIYWTVVTISTVGYGDISPSSDPMKVFTCFYAFFGIGTVGLMLSTGVAFFLEKHQKQVLGAVEKAVNKALKKVKGEGEGEEESDSSSDDDDDDDLVNLDPTGWNSRAVWRVCLALILMLGVLGSGIIVLVFVEGMTYVDALYTACISVSTIGYGDYSFQTVEGRVFAIFWLLAGTVVIGWCFVELTNAKLETQKQILQKQLIARNIKEEDFMVADLDKDSRIHESEFIVFKLREMSRVTDEEIKTLRERFRVLDKNQDGVLEMTKSGHYM